MREMLSVIVPTYNRLHLLRGALDSLMEQDVKSDMAYQIVVVDNGSTDGTRDFVKDLARTAPVPVCYLVEPIQGYPHALNRGVKEASGEWIALFDDDQLAQPNWLAELLYVARTKDAAIVGGSIKLQFEGDDTIKLGATCRSILGEKPLSGRPAKCVGNAIPSGGNVLINRVVFDSVGLFDEQLTSGGCDSELILRARNTGLSVWVAPAAVVSHRISRLRVSRQYLRWVSLRWGRNFAVFDLKMRGRAWMLCLSFARVIQAVCLTFPRFVLAAAADDGIRSLDCQLIFWRTLAYVRSTAYSVCPLVFPQEEFFSRLDFRKGRDLERE